MFVCHDANALNIYILETQTKYCKSVQGDCRHIPGACPTDRCIFQEKVSKFLSYYECQCPDGYTGNGIQCFDADGNAPVSADVYVELDMTMTNEFETFPFDGSEISNGVELQSLITEMGNVDSSCTSAGTCSSAFNYTEINN